MIRRWGKGGGSKPVRQPALGNGSEPWKALRLGTDTVRRRGPVRAAREGTGPGARAPLGQPLPAIKRGGRAWRGAGAPEAQGHVDRPDAVPQRLGTVQIWTWRSGQTPSDPGVPAGQQLGTDSGGGGWRGQRSTEVERRRRASPCVWVVTSVCMAGNMRGGRGTEGQTDRDRERGYVILDERSHTCGTLVWPYPLGSWLYTSQG